MSVNSVNKTNAYQYQNVQGTHKDTENKKAEETAKTEVDTKDTYVKSDKYKPDLNTVKAMKAELERSMTKMQNLVTELLGGQGKTWNTAMGQLGKTLEALSNIDAETVEWAKDAISEEGEWGVEATAARILDFAKALTGGDPSKIENMKAAVEKGFQEAERIWGGKLPEISQKTYDRVMEGFKEWEDSAKDTETDTDTTENAAVTGVTSTQA